MDSQPEKSKQVNLSLQSALDKDLLSASFPGEP